MKKKDPAVEKKVTPEQQSASQPGKQATIKSILITQPKPESDKSPYFDIARKYNVKVDFKPFVTIEPLSNKEFRKQHLQPATFGSLVLMNKQSVDIVFKIVEDMRQQMPETAKYYCLTESVALYLQKYIQFRKRKIFFGDGTVKSLLIQIEKHHNAENYFVACSDNPNKEISDFLKKKKYKFAEGVIYRSVPATLLPEDTQYDIITFFSPVGVQAIKTNFPELTQNGTLFGTFGAATTKALLDAGFTSQIQAPLPEAPSMAMALDLFLKATIKESV